MHYRLSPHLVVRTGWQPRPAEPGDRALVIRTGRAFPPSHPTTRLCLDLLREALREGGVASLVDVGCGTGILGLAAAALGVPRVVGVDLSWSAARMTYANARDNRLAPRLVVARGSTECLRAAFDLVVANLPWEVHLEKVAELHRLAGQEGRLIISGFRDNQEEPLQASYGQLGWLLLRRVVKDFWHPELPPDISFTWVAWLLGRKEG
jgi:ribosomal protein L11 methyltransferase